MSTVTPELAQQFRYAVLAVQRQGQRHLNTLLRPLGLTPAQAEAIEVLADYGPMTTREVGRHLLCESGSPSRILAALAQKNLSLRSHPADDKRVTLHALTKEGREKLVAIREVEKQFSAHLHDIIAASHISAEDLAQVVTLLSTVLTDPELKTALGLRFPHP